MNTVVIGSSREQKVPSMVLERSIIKNSLKPVRVIHTYDMEFPRPEHPKNWPRTGFSLVRFAVPELAGHEGIAAYLECDQLIFRDIADLFSTPFGDDDVVIRPENQPSVLLFDCAKAAKMHVTLQEVIDDLDKDVLQYRPLLEHLAVYPPSVVGWSIPECWNSLERYEEGETALLHYTNMEAQPWRKWGHPLQDLWLEALLDAVIYGAVARLLVESEVKEWHIVPEVYEWLHRRLLCPAK